MRPRFVLIPTTAAILVAAVMLGARSLMAVDRAPSMERGSVNADIDQRDTQIRVWKIALAQDPKSAIALGQLAALYVQRARETGDDHNYTDAEQYARRSLALRTNRNGPTFVTLAAALVAQHRFAEAESVATDVAEFYPDVPQYRA